MTWDQYDIFVNRLNEPAGNQEVDATSRPSKPYISYDRGRAECGYAATGMSFKEARMSSATGFPKRPSQIPLGDRSRVGARRARR